MSDKRFDELHKRLDSMQRAFDQKCTEVDALSRLVGDQGREFMAIKGVVSAFQQPVAPQPKPTVIHAADPGERGVQIRELVTRSQTFEPPSEAQTQRLSSIVSARHALFKQVNELEFHRTFLIVGELNRLPDGKLDTDHSLSWWADTLEDFGRQLSLPGSISYGAIVAACVAHGDVGFSNIGSWPFIDIGIAPPMYSGRPTNNKWKLIMNGASLPEPVGQPQRKPVEYAIIRPVAQPW